MAMEMVVRTTCMQRAYSVLTCDVQAGSVAVPWDMLYLMNLLKKAIESGCAYPPVSNKIGTSVPYGKPIVGSCVFGYFPFVSSRGRGPCRPDGRGGAASRGNWVRDEKVPKIPEVILVGLPPKHTAPSARRIG